MSADQQKAFSANGLAQRVMDLEHCLLVVRHGRTQWNAEDRLTTSSDIPLAPLGVEQAGELRTSLAGVVFDSTASSPLQRAQQTAEIALAETTSPQLRCDSRWMEPAAGPFEGLVFADLCQSKHPLAEAFARYQSETAPEYLEGVENITESVAKAEALIAEAAAAPGRHFAASHGAFARILACTFLGMDARRYRRLQLGNCHALLFRFYPEAPHQFAGWNLPPR